MSHKIGPALYELCGIVLILETYVDSSGASKVSGDLMVPALIVVWLGKKLSGCSEVTGNWHVWTAQDFPLPLCLVGLLTKTKKRSSTLVLFMGYVIL